VTGVQTCALPISGIEWVGEIPEHWENRKLKWDIFYQEGPGLRTFQFTEDGIRVICVSNITEKGIDFETTHTRHISKEEYEEKYKHFTVNDNDILLSSSGSIGKVCKYFYDGEPVILNTSTIRIHSKNNKKYIEDFVKYVLISNYVQIQLRFLMTGGIVSNFGPSHLDQIFNYVPPLTEQLQIVQFLDEKTDLIDKLISTKERKITLLKEQRTSLINQVVTKGLNPNVKMKDSGIEWIGKIPEHWEIKKLKHLCEITYGISPPDTTYNDEGIGVELINGPVEYSETDFGYTRSLKWTTEPKKFCKKGSLLFCLRGSTTGRMNITHKDVSIGRGVCSINSKRNQWFMIYSMFIIRIYIQKLISGSTFPSVVKDDVDNYQICNPSIQEQDDIVEYLNYKTKEIDDLIHLEQKKIDLLKEYRQSLISEVVTGKIKVTTDE
jgi:type I restriction enzyme S subunit